MTTTGEQMKKLTRMGMLVAVSVVLVYFIHFPLIPAASFLEYDPADIPIFIAAFMYGPLAGLAVTVVTSVVQGFTVSAGSGVIGVIMHILSTGSFVLVAGTIYQKNKTRKGAAIALIVGVLTMTLMMVGCNLVFIPLFSGAPVETVMAMMLPVIIPFNLAKAGINAGITFVLYKYISRIMK